MAVMKAQPRSWRINDVHPTGVYMLHYQIATRCDSHFASALSPNRDINFSSISSGFLNSLLERCVKGEE